MEKEQPLRGTPHYRGHIGAPPGSERHPGLHPARSVRTAARVAARVPAARARVPPARARAARRPPAAQAGASRATSARTSSSRVPRVPENERSKERFRQAGVATDGRAKCAEATCRAKLVPGTPRLGKVPPSLRHGHNLKTKWYHIDCMFVNFTRASRKSKTITDLADVEHLDSLSAPDRRRVAELIDAHVAERAAESGRSSPRSSRSSPPADPGNLVERCRALLGNGGRGPRVSLTNGRGETFDVAAGVFASRKRPRPRRSAPGLACWCGAPPDGDVRRCGGACGTWRGKRRLDAVESPRRTIPPFAGATRSAPARSTRRTASAAAAGARPTPGSAAPARPRSTARTPPRPSPARRSPPSSTPWIASTAPRPRRRAPTTAPRRSPSARGAASTPRGRGASRGVEEVLSSRSDSSKIGARRGSSATRPTTTARRRRRSGPARPRRPRYVRRHFPSPFSRRVS